MLDATHDPDARSWVDSAGLSGTPFPLQNLPFGVFDHPVGGGAPETTRVGVAIGDLLVDLAATASAGVLDALGPALRDACLAPRLNTLMALGPDAWSALRRHLHHLLREGDPLGDAHRPAVEAALRERASVRMAVPAHIGDYTDFYASVHHATNVGTMMRPDNPLLPNYKWVPIGYHGRASSVVVSGTGVVRPVGQTRPEGVAAPLWGPSRRIDYELELGLFVGIGNEMGRAIPIADADRHIFGVCLVNDWSARDMQQWEYQPLGPFLAKSFATTVSPWVVTREALAPFRVALASRTADDPAPLPYLAHPGIAARGAFDIELEVLLQTARMREVGDAPVRLSRSRTRDLYWAPAQLVTHHASNGCNLRPGDLLASGTVSGPERAQRGCLLELAWRGTEPVELPNGERRSFLEDGDEVVLTGWCACEGAASIGLGECRGRVLPAAGADA